MSSKSLMVFFRETGPLASPAKQDSCWGPIERTAWLDLATEIFPTVTHWSHGSGWYSSTCQAKNWNIRDAVEFNRHLRSEGEPIMTTAESHPSRNYQRVRTSQGLWQGGEGSPSWCSGKKSHHRREGSPPRSIFILTSSNNKSLERF